MVEAVFFTVFIKTVWLVSAQVIDMGSESFFVYKRVYSEEVFTVVVYISYIFL